MINENHHCYRYETEHFVLRQVTPADAPALLKCYSDPAAVALMNDDNCTGGFLFQTLAEMEDAIRFWNSEDFARPAVIPKATGQPVGTLEIFGGETGVLRVDLPPAYEQEGFLRELYALALGRFTQDFPMKALVTKAPPAAQARRQVLAGLGFIGPEGFRGYPDYYRMPLHMRRELGIACCGLACCLCSENDACPGCQKDGCRGAGSCQNLLCCREKGLHGCWECEDFPCSAPMLQKPKPRAFGAFVRAHGVDALLDALERGMRAGVVYHRQGISGDYDLDTEEQVLALLEKAAAQRP